MCVTSAPDHDQRGGYDVFDACDADAKPRAGRVTTEGLQLGLFTQDLAQQIDPSKVALDVVMETVRAQNFRRGGRGGVTCA